jgi:hypothetical protein
MTRYSKRKSWSSRRVSLMGVTGKRTCAKSARATNPARLQSSCLAMRRLQYFLGAPRSPPPTTSDDLLSPSPHTRPRVCKGRPDLCPTFHNPRVCLSPRKDVFRRPNTHHYCPKRGSVAPPSPPCGARIHTDSPPPQEPTPLRARDRSSPTSTPVSLSRRR